MGNKSNQGPSYGGKNLGDYRDLGRGPVTSYYRRLAAVEGHPPDAGVLKRLQSFTSNIANWPKWASHVARYLGSPKHFYQTYKNGSGVFDMGDQALLSIAGDWGTGTDEARHVMSQMEGHKPDYTIHLGDVYYVGDKPEISENCLGKSNSKTGTTGVTWLPGTKGSFALMGNHEMYACGDAYFNEFLKKLGPLDGNGTPKGQEASFFALENTHWKIIGLDTGYYSAGPATVLNGLSHILGHIPAIQNWFRKSPTFKPSCKLHASLMEWLKGVLNRKAEEPEKEIILLSHHQYYSSFEDWYQNAAVQLREFIPPDKTVLWFWGHEHRMAIYDRFGVKDGIRAFGRCVGHGGMPVARGAIPEIKDCRCVIYDNRAYPNNENIDVGYNGFANLRFDGPVLTVEYYDLYNTRLLAEKWTTANGQLVGPEMTDVNADLTQDESYVKQHETSAAYVGH
jgi:hypothetical protein